MPEEAATSYHPLTPEAVKRLLEYSRLGKLRIRVHYGDTETGLDWGDTYDVTGIVGRSMGPVKVPILLHNRRSRGGGAMLDHCIVRIRHANKRDSKDGGDLYRHPKYHIAP